MMSRSGTWGRVPLLAIALAISATLGARHPAATDGDPASTGLDVAWFAAEQQPRDAAGPDVLGNAVIAGVVVSADDARTPIRRAVVTASGSALTRARSAITDDKGRFAITGLPEGRFVVTARKAAYLDMTFGARRPGRPGTPVSTSDRARTDIVIPLVRGGVITGIVRDEAGVPAAGVAVVAIDARADDARVYGEADQITTDDRGMYRIYGLPAGEYFIVATARSVGIGLVGRPSVSDLDGTFSRLEERGRTRRPGGQRVEPMLPDPAAAPVTLVPVFHPAAAGPEDARRVRVAPGEVRTGIDITMVPMPAARIAGIVTDAGGPLGTGVQLSITRENERRMLGRGLNASWPVLSQPPGDDGRFVYTNVPPGQYTIVARSRRMDGVPTPAPSPSGGRGAGGGGAVGSALSGSRSSVLPGEGYFFARVQVSVTGGDIDGLTLALRPGVRLSGRVVLDSASDPPFALTDLAIRLRPAAGSFSSTSANTVMGNSFSSVQPADVDAEGSFSAVNIGPDRYVLVAAPPQAAEGWWLRSAEVGGRDLLDAPFEIGDTDITGVVLTYTDRKTELTGLLQTAAGVAAPDYFIVVVPADRERWVAGSRRMQAVRPATDGRFSVTQLPAGNYLIAALTDFEPADFGDASFLDQLAAIAVPVVIRDGAETVQDLRLGQ